MLAQPPSRRRDRILVSACLVGVPCRYDGRSCPQPELCSLLARGQAVAICPEVAGGLSTPRLPAEIEGAGAGLDGHDVLAGRTRVLRSDGLDVSAQFLAGAHAALDLVQDLGIRQAVLKAHSPSCGVGAIYDGLFSGRLVAGDGVTAALLKRVGVEVVSEIDWKGEMWEQSQ